MDLDFDNEGGRHLYDGPVKVICGVDSEYTSPYILDNFGKAIKNFDADEHVSWIADAGHWVHVDKPNEFVEEVASFIKAL